MSIASFIIIGIAMCVMLLKYHVSSTNLMLDTTLSDFMSFITCAHRLLPARRCIGTVARLWELWRPICVPAKLLRAYCAGSPAVGRILHPMIYDPILATIGRSCERRMANTICGLTRILVEDWVRVLVPITRIHWIVTNQLELGKTIVAVIGTRRTVNEELLARRRICELLRTLI